MKKNLFALLALTLVLAACSSSAGTTSGAPKAVEDYLAALVGQDADKISTLSCADCATCIARSSRPSTVRPPAPG